jgi:hypothetical protein
LTTLNIAVLVSTPTQEYCGDRGEAGILRELAKGEFEICHGILGFRFAI